MNAAPARFKGQASILLQIASPPCFRTSFHTLELGIPMFTAFCPLHRQLIFIGLVDFIRNITGISLIKLSVLQTRKSLQSVNTGSQFIHSHIIFRSSQAVLQTAEKYRNLVGLHVGICWNQLIAVILTVQIQQVVFFTQNLTALIQGSHINAHVVFLCIKRNADQFRRLQFNSIDLAQCLQEGQYHRCRGGKPSDGQRALNDATESDCQWKPIAQRPCSTPQIVCPVARFFPDFPNMPLGSFRELKTAHFNNAIHLGLVCNMDSLINRKSCDLS